MGEREMDADDKELNEAYRLYSLGKRVEAVKRLEAMVNANPQRGHAWECLGVVQYNMGNFTQATDCLRTASSLTPLSICARLALAHCYVQCNALGLARECFMQLATSDDVSKKHLPEIARGLGLVGLSHEALQVCLRLVELDPNHHQAAFGVAYYMAICEFPLGQVSSWFERALDLAPKNIRYRTEYAQLLHSKGETERANLLIKDLYLEQLASIRCKNCLRQLAVLFRAAGDTLRCDICVKRLRNCDEGAEVR